MSKDKYTFEKGDNLVLFHEKFGFVRAFAVENHSNSPGTLAIFKVGINSESLPGITAMTINTNQWNVYHEDDLEMLKKVLDAYVPYWMTR